MLKKFSPLLISLSLFATNGLGDELPIKIEGAWIQAVPRAAEATAAYMTVYNTGQKPIQLTGGSSPIATKIEPMVTTREIQNGHQVMGMETVTGLQIAPGETLVLKPGGNHLMIMNLTSHPKEGEQVKLTIRFDPGNETIDLEVPVYKRDPK